MLAGRIVSGPMREVDPMKALIWEEDGAAYIGYNSADHLAARHGLEGCDEAPQKVEGALERFASEAAGQ